MVKVVGIDRNAVRRITCKECASILEYTTNDVQTHTGTDYRGWERGCTYVNCPNCRKGVTILSW